jgi:trigger factor
MEITHKTLSKTRIQYQVKLTGVETGNFFTDALQRLSKNVKISGFRPGKAPAELIRKQIDAAALREEAYSLAVHDAWHAIIKELKVVPIQDPEVEIIDFEEDKPSTLQFSFDIRPEITVKGWEKIKLGKAKLEPVTDADVDKVLESLGKGHAQQAVTLEEAQKGDRVDITFEGSIGGVRKDKLSAAKFPVMLGEASVLPGFEKELPGVKKGDEKEFSVPFPKDHYDEELAGNTVDFSLKVDEVYKVTLPKLDDEFGKKFGHDTLEQLKQAIRSELETERLTEYEQSRRAEWLAEFDKCITVEVPETLLHSEIERSKNAWQTFLEERHLSAEDWLKRRKITMEQMEKDWRKAAEASVRVGLGLSQLAKEQGKELSTNDDFQEYLGELIEKTK